MDEKMLFPKTWEEFEKHYGFYDIKQAYMFGNTRLIPSFRVQQWLDHIDDIKRKKQPQKKMKERGSDGRKMTKQDFWEKIGYVFERDDIPCEKCPAYYTVECCKSCEYALKAMYERLECEE